MSAPTALFVRDKFDGANGTALASHTPNYGGAWTAALGTAEIQANELRSLADTSYYNATTVTYDANDQYTLYMKHYSALGSMPTFTGFRFNWDPGADTYYQLVFGLGTSKLRIYRIVSGSATFPSVADSSTMTIPTSGEHEYVVSVINTPTYVSFEVYIDGVLKWAPTDSQGSRITTPGKAGFRFGDGSSNYAVRDFAAYNGFQLTPYEPVANEFWTGFVSAEEIVS